MQKHILIIGGGIAGLAAGCYARINGYRATIFEMHHLPGGLCTAWERKGYTFDGCIHYLFGSGEGQPFYDLWQELGAVQNRPIIYHSEYQRITDGRDTLIVYCDPNQLEDHLCEISPRDASLIKQFCDGVRQFIRFDLSALYRKPRQLMNSTDWREFGLKMMPYLIPMAKWATLSAGEFASRFHHPFLRRAFAQMFSWEEAPLMMGMALLAYMNNRNAGFPSSGSLAFAQAIEKRFLELGGEISYQSQVEKILVENNRAVGIRLYSDEVYSGDIIISACDGRTTIFDMLDGKYTNRQIRRMYDGHLPMHSMMQISLGVKRDFSNFPHWVTYLLDHDVLIAGEPRREIGVKHYCFDPTLAPAGKSVVEIIVRAHYPYWQHIYGRRVYDEEQHQVSDILSHYLETWYPGIDSDVEVIDEATPLSYERYTGNWQGSTCGFLLTKETMPMLINGVPKTLPGLKNFYLAGQWVEPGGSLPLSAASGKNVIQIICASDGKPFITQ
ncbi:MAG: NAD(P)/FAD-dependent oxidoreductase [Anaerolineae bacterium]|jgi:phytoene dehydrogenase-like protein|nr:MAG: NAD(P)/FAD-dependent oxidoreductase [Anaerolineae bacterium]